MTTKEIRVGVEQYAPLGEHDWPDAVAEIADAFETLVTWAGRLDATPGTPKFLMNDIDSAANATRHTLSDLNVLMDNS